MAVAKDGEANVNVKELLGEILGIKKRDISIAAGGKSRDKVIAITGLTYSQIYLKLHQAAGI